MNKPSRREALIALGTAVAVPSVVGLAEAASPVVAPQVRHDRQLFLFSGHSDDGRMDRPHKLYRAADRMEAVHHAAVLRLLDGEPMPKDEIVTEHFGWTIGYTENGINLYLSGLGHPAHAPVSHPEFQSRFVVAVDGKRYPVSMKYQLQAYPGPTKSEPIVTLVRFEFVPEKTTGDFFRELSPGKS